MMSWGFDFGWGWLLLMGFGMVLWIALLVVLVWALIRWLQRKTTVAPPQEGAPPVGGPSALEILRQRYARGEIDRATFEQMHERLAASGVHTEQPIAARYETRS